MAIIKDPGKFEGETEFVRASWNMAMDGCEDETFYDDETEVSVFKIAIDDVAKWPDDLSREDDGKFLLLWETDQGFVMSNIVDADALAKIKADCESDTDDE